MLNPRTPGVYVQELSLLPPSVAPVATAIPAFIGYTEKRGSGFPENTPVRITSLIDFEEIFGGPFDENYTVTLTDDGDDVAIAAAPHATSPYLLYYAVQHYYANGGGPCYIVSVGLYDHDNPSITAQNFKDGVDALEQEDEPTLLVVPEAVRLDTLERKNLHTKMLTQCYNMQDRFALMDVLVNGGNTPLQDATAFRGEVGMEYLKYGAAYYPSLKTTITKYYDEATVNIVDDRGGVGSGPFHGEPLSILFTGSEGYASGTITVDDFSALPGSPEITVNGKTIAFSAGADNDATATNIANAITADGDVSPLVTATANAAVVTITAKTPGTGGNAITLVYADNGLTLSGPTLTGGKEGSHRASASATLTITSGFKKIAGESFSIKIDATTTTLTEGDGQQFEIGESSAETASNIKDAINTAGIAVTASVDGNVVTIVSNTAGVAGNDIELVYSGTSGARFSGPTLEGGVEGGDTQDVDLYNKIKAVLNARKVDLYPSAAMAGIYARVDRTRGVWKAPANVSMNLVSKTNVLVTSEEQGDLNVDSNTGKSVNVIRPFTGKGILVWGARTLAGNDNEWRYIPVRRLFIFIEESIQKASEPFVFEPNDANTWIKMKAMIENFLSSLWRDGALAGAAPADAFFVKVGLGETMTSLDILEGRLNVEVGIAAVRPAEFIILKFSHKLQES